MTTAQSLKSNCLLKLFVNGTSIPSKLAVRSLDKLCREVLAGDYEVTVIDVLETPEAADAERIMCAPTLLKTFPLPKCKVVGDLSDHESVLRALELPPELLGDARFEGSAPEPAVRPAGMDAARGATLALEQCIDKGQFHKLVIGCPDGMLVLDGDGIVARSAFSCARGPDPARFALGGARR